MLQPQIREPTEVQAAMQTADADVLLAAETFGAALRGSPEFASLLAADQALSEDVEATAAIDVFGRRQAELRIQVMFGALDAAQRAELEGLQSAMLACPSVAAYVAAQAAFQAVCRETAAVVSAEIGIDFAANCRSGGCCG